MSHLVACSVLNQVGVKPIRSYSDKMQAEEVKKAIIVVRGGITPFARSAITELCAQRDVSVITGYVGAKTPLQAPTTWCNAFAIAR